MDDNIYDAVLLDVVNRIPDPGIPLIIGANPPENGVGIAWTGGTETRYLHCGSKIRMSVVLNVKHELQLTALRVSGAICTALSAIRRFEQNERYRIIGIKIQNAPTFAGREKSGQWVYAASLAVTFATKGE